MFARLLMFADMRTFVDVSGRRIARYRGFDAPGAGVPAVVLPGAGLVGLDYWPIAGRDTVLYDRCGTGWSSAVALPRSAADVATELHDAIGPGPWVLVAHSIGAIYARRFAQLYPESVRGLLLIDPGHEDLFDYLPPAAVELNSALKPDPAQLPDLTAAQLSAAREAYARLFAAWPTAVRDELSPGPIFPRATPSTTRSPLVAIDRRCRSMSSEASKAVAGWPASCVVITKPAIVRA
jgi:pimeloyl-ACP methyl ester carboxylesterase